MLVGSSSRSPVGDAPASPKYSDRLSPSINNYLSEASRQEVRVSFILVLDQEANCFSCFVYFFGFCYYIYIKRLSLYELSSGSFHSVDTCLLVPIVDILRDRNLLIFIYAHVC